MKPRTLLALVFAFLVMLSAGSPPVLDEESYLDIGAQIAKHPERPYDWFRAWQPWGATPPPDAYLFAHPPLHLWWISLCQSVVPAGAALRLVGALPWALLLGWSLGRLAERQARPWTTGLALVASPALVLATQAGLMIDLDTLALSCAALVLWREPGAGAALLAGLLGGLAAETKYPALLLSLAVGIDALLDRGSGAWKRLIIYATGFGVVFGGIELFLATTYQRVHLLEVLREADRIARGSLLDRGAGVLVRLGLCLPPLWFSRRALKLAAPAALVVGASCWGRLDPALLVWTALLGGAGWAALVRGLTEPGDRLLRLWAGLAVLGVLLGHNYVGGRYLLPAVVPLVLLFADRGPRTAAVLWLPLALAAGYAERAYAEAAEQVALQAAAGKGTAGWFTGEWTFRARMEAMGWRFWSPEEKLPSGAVLVVPQNASPAAPPPGWSPDQSISSSVSWPLRLIDLERGVGYHAETLGPAPLGWGSGPLESAQVGRVR